MVCVFFLIKMVGLFEKLLNVLDSLFFNTKGVSDELISLKSNDV
jgi:hypothetical protein